MDNKNTKRPIITLEDALSALERKRKEISRLRQQNNRLCQQNNHLEALVEDLKRKVTAQQ